MNIKQQAKDFIDSINWKRTFKIVLVIIPVLIWEVWYNGIKIINDVNEKINKAGDGFLSNFVDN